MNVIIAYQHIPGIANMMKVDPALSEGFEKQRKMQTEKLPGLHHGFYPFKIVIRTIRNCGAFCGRFCLCACRRGESDNSFPLAAHLLLVSL